MDTNRTQLVDAIHAVLNNPNESLCYCDEGWLPVYKDWAGQCRDEYVIITDREGLHAMAGGYDPAQIVEGLAEHCIDSLAYWLQEALDDELDSPEPDEDRVAMLREVLK
jgi:hypothetical protein